MAIADDQNGDGMVDWQDGAIAYRGIMEIPQGSENIKNNVVSQIAFNIASQPTHPFLRTLDEIKKSYLYTDGLGQDIMLKGYQDQCHDSAHPDYGDNYNEGAGGLDDLKTLVEESKKYNTNIGVHINQTKMYPEAENFRWDLTKDLTPAWKWLDQSYKIDATKDLVDESFQKRIDKLQKDVPDLTALYVDVYFDRGWNAYQVAKTINDAGWAVYTEYSGYFWSNFIWHHHSAEYDSGIDSSILQFIYNPYMDNWYKKDSLLKGPNNLSFMG